MTARLAAGVLTFLAASMTACSGPVPGSSLPLTQFQDFTLPGAASRLDYQALDAGAKRLYIAHLAFIACEGSAKLLVLDLDTKRITAPFDTGEGPDVLALDQGLRRLCVASESAVVSVFDEQNRALTLKASGKLADNAHTVAVDQATHRVHFPLEDVNGKPVLRIMDAKPSS